MSFINIAFKLDGFTELPHGEIDDDEIGYWIEDRLNDGRNEFITNVSRKGDSRSKPGEYPKTDGGRLVNSANAQMTGNRSGVLGSDVEYALYLTTGTKFMGARKMFVDALTEVLKKRPENERLAKAASLKIGVPGVRSIT